MYWLFLLLALGCFAFAIKTPSTSLMMFSLLAALLFFLAWVRARYVAQFGDAQSGMPCDIHSVIDPTELRRLREQAQARRDAQRDETDTDTP